MFFCNSYRTAYQSCIANNGISVARLTKMSKNMDIDTSGCYKIFYLLSGNKRFHINEQIHEVNAGDLFLMTSMDWHYFSNFQEEDTHERIIFFISDHYFEQHKTPHTDLRSCFTLADGQRCFKISLSVTEQAHMMHLISKLMNVSGYGADILDSCYFLELLVFLNQLATRTSAGLPFLKTGNAEQAEELSDILEYINVHIAEEITAASLAAQFFVSETYICRYFKKYSGLTLHKYITAQRIVLSKKLLAAGASVSDACQQSGFNDYSHFIKVFKKAVGIPPKQFSKMSTEHI